MIILFAAQDETLTPLQVSNLAAWYDASDTASITHASGAVSQWNDKSGNAKHATQATAASKPTTGTRTVSGRNVIDYDGTDDFLNIAAFGLTAHTKVVVLQVDSLSAPNNTLSNVTGNDALWMNSTSVFNSFISGTIITGNTVLTTGTTIIVVQTCDAFGRTHLYVNGVYQGMGERAITTGNTPYIGRYGSGNYLNGVLGEIALYSRVLTISEINGLGRGLAAKWGGTWTTALDKSTTALRTVALGNRGPTARQTCGGTGTHHGVRWATIIAQDASDLVLSFANWYGNNSNVEEFTGNDITVVEFSVEGPSGTVVPVYFNGSRSVLLKNGVNEVQCDPILPASFGLSKFSRNEKFFVKGILSVASSAHYIPYTSRYQADNTTDDQTVTWDPAATTPSSTDIAGKYTASGTGFTGKTQGFQPIVLGTPLVSSTPAYIIVGDSIADYASDGTSAGLGGRAFANRAMHDAPGTSVVNPIPSINFARYGSWSTLAKNGGKWKNYIKYTNSAIEEYGTNDIGNGVTVATLQTDIAALWASLRRNFSGSVTRIIRTQLLPRTTSTDTYITEANQTYTAKWGEGQEVSQFNDWLDTKRFDGTVDHLVPMNAARGINPLKFIVTGAANYATSDGTHPSAAVHELLAAELRNYLADPLQVSNLAAWYDASDTVTLMSAGGTVSQWNDKSGNARHVSQSVSASQPSLSGTTITFDGTDDFLYNTTPFMYTAGACTILIVMKSNGASAADVVISESNSVTGNPVYSIFATNTSSDSSHTLIKNDAASVLLDLSLPLGDTTFDNTLKIVTATDTGSVFTTYNNDNAGTTPRSYTRSGTFTGDRFTIGALIRTTISSYMDMEVNEILVYDRVLTSTEMDKLNRYLTKKWSVSGVNTMFTNDALTNKMFTNDALTNLRKAGD